MYTIIIISLLAVATVGTLLAAMTRYKTCPPNAILVKYGLLGGSKAARPYHGGATFVWPLFQKYAFLDLTPMTTNIPLAGALSKQNIRVNVPSRVTYGIGITEELMNAAAERLLNRDTAEIESLASEIIFGQLRVTIAAMDIEEINADREGFEKKSMENIERELSKVGLKLININIADIQDESGYIEALGKKAAAEAVNRAKVEVAERDRDGEVGAVNAKKEERVNVASANADAVTGENLAKVTVANSDAERREKEAEAQRRGDAAGLVKDAQAKQEGYQAEQSAELARAERQRASQTADIVVPAEIAKQELVIGAQASMEQAVLAGKGRGEALQAELEGQAKGIEAVVKAAGSADKAAMLMIIEHLPKIAELQATAISNIKFDKIVVMDGGGSGGGNTTANWLSGITKILPGLHEFAEMAGIKLPSALGKIIEDDGNKGSPEAINTDGVQGDGLVTGNDTINQEDK